VVVLAWMSSVPSPISIFLALPPLSPCSLSRLSAVSHGPSPPALGPVSKLEWDCSSVSIALHRLLVIRRPRRRASSPWAQRPTSPRAPACSALAAPPLLLHPPSQDRLYETVVVPNASSQNDTRVCGRWVFGYMCHYRTIRTDIRMAMEGSVEVPAFSGLPAPRPTVDASGDFPKGSTVGAGRVETHPLPMHLGISPRAR
jgi:hypothetical protein